MIYAFIIIVFLTLIANLLSGVKWKGIFTVSAIIALVGLSSYAAVPALLGNTFQHTFTGNFVFGTILLKIDALSAWFILVINFTFITGAFYGLQYMKMYADRKNALTMHSIAFVILYLALISVCTVQNMMVFLIFWELIALSAFVLVIFEGNKASTLKAGLNYLIQSHISIVFLMLGFIYVAFKTGSFDFSAISQFASEQPSVAGVILFLFLFIGFAIKAGFVPFHTWLPYAHPAAPAHVSGIMSGVLIKIGIYGILRMLVHINSDYTTIGYIVLIVSIVSGLYGVMLAIVQHNLKRLLAYHSIENIGIIGLGIGIGCIGLGMNNPTMATLGFMGALLHTLNHSLFKSLLFYTAGNIYQITHGVNIEKLGGIIKHMPHTALLFLISALAICGLPPFNGFISEFIIYGGFYQWLIHADSISLIAIIFTIIALVMIGGLAIICFTKAFGVVFLGTNRNPNPLPIHEVGRWQFYPLYAIAILIIAIGLFSPVFVGLLNEPVQLFVGSMDKSNIVSANNSLQSLSYVNIYSAFFIGLVLIIWGLRKLSNKNKEIIVSSTWGCGYCSSDPKLQYTASSYVRSFTKLFKSILFIHKKEVIIHDVFPNKSNYETHPYDRIEYLFIDKPLQSIKLIFRRFAFLQKGRIQHSILYGILFISMVIILPLFYDKILLLFYYLTHL